LIKEKSFHINFFFLSFDIKRNVGIFFDSFHSLDFLRSLRALSFDLLTFIEKVDQKIQPLDYKKKSKDQKIESLKYK